MPSLAGAEQARLQQETYETLTALVADAAVRVRAAVADVLKDMPQAPRALILQLAQDQAVMVSAPIIRFSPLLTTEDLLALIAEAALAGNRRRSGRTARHRHAGVRRDCRAPPTARRSARCCATRSAQIREATLDALVARARRAPGVARAAGASPHAGAARRPRVGGHRRHQFAGGARPAGRPAAGRCGGAAPAGSPRGSMRLNPHRPPRADGG